MKFSDTVYNVLKFVAQVALPGAGTLYFTVANIWGLPEADAVVGTVVAVDTFLGVLLGLSSNQYNKSDARYDGTFDVVEENDGLVTMKLNLERNPEALENQDEVRFKVVRRAG